MIDRKKLRELAEKATPGPWNSYVYVDHDGPPGCDDIGIQAPSKKRSMHVEVLCKMDWYDGGSSDFERADAESTAEYIAEIPPETILALLDAIEAADVRNTLLSACLHKAEDERDRLREDAKRLDWLNNASEMGLVEFGFEMDGGVFMRNSEAGGPEVDFRERNSVREAIDAARKE